MIGSISTLISAEKDIQLRTIADKILNKERISFEDGVLLFEKASLPFVGALANHVREREHGDGPYLNRKFHLEPTNICVLSSSFSSYSNLNAHRRVRSECKMDANTYIRRKLHDKPTPEVVKN